MAIAPPSFFRSIERASLALDQTIAHLSPAAVPVPKGSDSATGSLPTAIAQVREALGHVESARSVTRDGGLRDALAGARSDLGKLATSLDDSLHASTAPPDRALVTATSVRSTMDAVTAHATKRNAAASAPSAATKKTSAAAAPAAEAAKKPFGERHPVLMMFAPFGVLAGIMGGVRLLDHVFGSPDRDAVFGPRPAEPRTTGTLAATLRDTYDRNDDGAVSITDEEYSVDEDVQTKAARALLLDADSDHDGSVELAELQRLVDRFDDGVNGGTRRNGTLEPGELLVMQTRYADREA